MQVLGVKYCSKFKKRLVIWHAFTISVRKTRRNLTGEVYNCPVVWAEDKLREVVCRSVTPNEWLIKCLTHWGLAIHTHASPNHRQTSNIRRIKSQNLNVSRLVLQLSLSNPLKPCVDSRMKRRVISQAWVREIKKGSNFACIYFHLGFHLVIRYAWLYLSFSQILEVMKNTTYI